MLRGADGCRAACRGSRGSPSIAPGHRRFRSFPRVVRVREASRSVPGRKAMRKLLGAFGLAALVCVSFVSLAGAVRRRFSPDRSAHKRAAGEWWSPRARSVNGPVVSIDGPVDDRRHGRRRRVRGQRSARYSRAGQRDVLVGPGAAMFSSRVVSAATSSRWMAASRRARALASAATCVAGRAERRTRHRAR